MKPILIAGPTAAGKSALALAIAGATGATILNADAMQVYSCWRVLSARPSAEEEARAPHALFGHVDPARHHSVGAWLREAAPFLDGRPLVIVGGTGLYFTALTEGLAPIPPVPDTVRAEADRAMRDHGPGWFRSALAADDPETLAQIDASNPARLQRAWEVLRATRRGLRAWQADTPAPLLPLKAATPLVLAPAVDWLDRRIAARFETMLDAGAIDEVRGWRRLALPDSTPAAKALGRAEIEAFIDGGIDRQTCIARATLVSRRYAKRQRTWFRNRLGDWPRLDPAIGTEALLTAVMGRIDAERD
ncbi:MAG: tRNA (adenosine(37)-N6)-dimethylallyltransferase MiaA [Rubricella sp.]